MTKKHVQLQLHTASGFILCSGQTRCGTTWLDQRTLISTVSTSREQVAALTHLFIHEDVDDGVDDGAGLGQHGRDDAGLRRDQARWAKGGQQCHDAVGQPAQQVAAHHHHHHKEHALLPLPAHRGVDATDLPGRGHRGEGRLTTAAEGGVGGRVPPASCC